METPSRLHPYRIGDIVPIMFPGGGTDEAKIERIHVDGIYTVTTGRVHILGDGRPCNQYRAQLVPMLMAVRPEK